MNDASRSLGFKLISVSVALTAVAALIVGVLVTKLSEDATKERLYASAEEVAAAVEEARAAAPGGAAALDRALLAAKLGQAGSAWILEKDGALLANPESGLTGAALNPAALTIQLLGVRKPLAQGGKTEGNVPLRELVGKYEAGYGILRIGDAKRVLAFRTLPGSGWLVGVDEPLDKSDNVTASLKRYVLLTCAILGVCIILSTIVSISFIIQPYNREQAALTRRIEAAHNNLQKLHGLSVGMQKHLDLDQRMRDVLSAAREVVGMDRIFIFLPDEGKTMLQCFGAVGNRDEKPEEIRVPLGAGGGTYARAFANKEVLHVASGGAEPPELAAPYNELKALKSREYAVLPLVVENACVGVVMADNQLSKLPITHEKIQGMELFLNQAAVAIQNANMYAKLKSYADRLEITDHLTGVFTSEHFNKLMGQELAKAQGGKSPLALCVVGVANFADYNRLSGHRNGDEVLSRIAATVKNDAAGEGVTVGRCFGSTFGILFAGGRAAEAAGTLERIAEELARNAYPDEKLLEGGKLRFQKAHLPYDPTGAASSDDYLSRAVDLARKSAA